MPRDDKLIIQHMPLVRRIVARYVRRYPFRESMAEDIYSAGIEGLIHAATRFDPSRGVSFGVYADKRISGAIVDSLRAADHLSRRGREIFNAKKAAGIEDRRLMDPLPLDMLIDHQGDHVMPIDESEYGDPFELVARREEVARIERASFNLSPRIRLALLMYYRDGAVLKEIASVMGVTESRACQMINEAHVKLSHDMEYGIVAAPETGSVETVTVVRRAVVAAPVLGLSPWKAALKDSAERRRANRAARRQRS